MTRRLPAFVAAFSLTARSLAACTPMPQTGDPLPPTAMTCDAAPAAWAIGQVASADVVERVRADSHSRIARVLHPGQIITMEFSAERVNVKVDAGNAIEAVTCG